MNNMKTTTIFKMTVLFLIVLSVVSCKGNKGGLDNQESDTMMVAKDSIPFVLKHLDVDKKKSDGIRYLFRTYNRLFTGNC